MRKWIKKAMRRSARPLINQLELSTGNRFINDEPAAQKMLWQQYRALAAQGGAGLPDFKDAGFRKYSQFEEDGILLLIFAAIGATNRSCVEICAGNGRECMCAN